MAKIDRLGWASGVCFTSFGLKIGIRVNTPEVPAEVLSCIPPGWQAAEPPFVDLLLSLKIARSAPGERSRQFHLAYFDLERIGRSLDLAEVYETVEGRLQLHVAEFAQGRIFVHGGVVGWHGQAIVLPGRSFAGKSTLVAALLRAGATYYSDEYAVLDEHGRVHPYPRRLALRQSGLRLPRRCGPEELGSVTGSTPLPVGIVALAKYQPDAQWQPRPLSQGKAVMELLNHTISVLRKPTESVTVMHKAVTKAKILKGPRGEAEKAAHALLLAAA